MKGEFLEGFEEGEKDVSGINYWTDFRKNIGEGSKFLGIKKDQGKQVLHVSDPSKKTGKPAG